MRETRDEDERERERESVLIKFLSLSPPRVQESHRVDRGGEQRGKEGGGGEGLA